MEKVTATPTPTPTNLFDSLGVTEVAAAIGFTRAALLTKRSVAPDFLPPPYLLRPLRWRKETVLAWVLEQEKKHRASAALLAKRQAAPQRQRRVRQATKNNSALTTSPN